MEYIKNLDTQIDNLLDNDIVYSMFVLLIIFVIVFPPMSEVIGKHLNRMSSSIFNLSDSLNLQLYILCILYILNKDVRIGFILTIMLLIMYEKENIKIVNKQILQILVQNISFEQRLKILEKK